MLFSQIVMRPAARVWQNQVPPFLDMQADSHHTSPRCDCRARSQRCAHDKRSHHVVSHHALGRQILFAGHAAAGPGFTIMIALTAWLTGQAAHGAVAQLELGNEVRLVVGGLDSRV